MKLQFRLRTLMIVVTIFRVGVYLLGLLVEIAMTRIPRGKPSKTLYKTMVMP